MSGVNILPQNAILESNSQLNNDDTLEPTKTFGIDLTTGRVKGFIDNLESLKQAIHFILTTERYEYIIYPWSYGSELRHIKSLDKDIMESELERCITEALVEDDRIYSVNNFSFEYSKENKDSVIIKFTVFSVYGEVQAETEV